MKHPIDDDPPGDWHRQAGNDKQNFLDEQGHFCAKSRQEFVVKHVFVTRGPTLETRTRHRQRGKVGDCATGRLLAAESGLRGMSPGIFWKWEQLR